MHMHRRFPISLRFHATKAMHNASQAENITPTKKRRKVVKPVLLPGIIPKNQSKNALLGKSIRNELNYLKILLSSTKLSMWSVPEIEHCIQTLCVFRTHRLEDETKLFVAEMMHLNSKTVYKKSDLCAELLQHAIAHQNASLSYTLLDALDKNVPTELMPLAMELYGKKKVPEKGWQLFYNNSSNTILGTAALKLCNRPNNVTQAHFILNLLGDNVKKVHVLEMLRIEIGAGKMQLNKCTDRLEQLMSFGDDSLSGEEGLVLLQECEKAQNDVLALHVMSHVKAPHSASYNIVIQSCARLHEPVLAQTYYEQSAVWKVVLHPMTYKALFDLTARRVEHEPSKLLYATTIGTVALTAGAIAFPAWMSVLSNPYLAHVPDNLAAATALGSGVTSWITLNVLHSSSTLQQRISSFYQRTYDNTQANKAASYWKDFIKSGPSLKIGSPVIESFVEACCVNQRPDEVMFAFFPKSKEVEHLPLLITHAIGLKVMTAFLSRSQSPTAPINVEPSDHPYASRLYACMWGRELQLFVQEGKKIDYDVREMSPHGATFFIHLTVKKLRELFEKEPGMRRSAPSITFATKEGNEFVQYLWKSIPHNELKITHRSLIIPSTTVRRL